MLPEKTVYQRLNKKNHESPLDNFRRIADQNRFDYPLNVVGRS